MLPFLPYPVITQSCFWLCSIRRTCSVVTWPLYIKKKHQKTLQCCFYAPHHVVSWIIPPKLAGSRSSVKPHSTPNNKVHSLRADLTNRPNPFILPITGTTTLLEITLPCFWTSITQNIIPHERTHGISQERYKMWHFIFRYASERAGKAPWRGMRHKT